RYIFFHPLFSVCSCSSVSLALVCYSMLFMRFAYKVQPRNWLLFAYQTHLYTCIPVTLPLHYFTLTDALKHFIKSN
uniref:Mitochondrial pyruvate carrier n=1 Tax=Astyanax mexicanus TaxID=7994 RepID=A0A8B9JJM3_ASTMX